MKIAVIGAGPAGMMAAISASKGADVQIFERNEKLGKKLYITGKGRCNITNTARREEFFKNIITNPKFMYSSFSKFDNFSLMDFFSVNKLELKVERGNRVYPKSDKSSDIISTYKKVLEKNNVKIHLNTRVREIKKSEDKFLVDGILFDKVIIATGGISYKSTGSTGDGYNFAREFKIDTVEPKSALSAMIVRDTGDLSGLSLKNVLLKAKSGKIYHEEFGEMLFTHFGISGPIVLTMSSRINRLENISLSIDFKPALDFDTLDGRILRDFKKYINKDIKNALNDLLPKDMILKVLKQAKIPYDIKVNQIKADMRRRILMAIKDYKLEFVGLCDIDSAIVTSGGVNICEVSPKTMESKKVKGLYFCGEVLDIDALTGGYNLQIANTTGFVAGNSCLEEL